MLPKNATSTTLIQKEQIVAASIGNMRLIPAISRLRQKYVTNYAKFDEHVIYRAFPLWTSTSFPGVAFNLPLNLFIKKTSLSCFVENR